MANKERIYFRDEHSLETRKSPRPPRLGFVRPELVQPSCTTFPAISGSTQSTRDDREGGRLENQRRSASLISTPRAGSLHPAFAAPDADCLELVTFVVSDCPTMHLNVGLPIYIVIRCSVFTLFLRVRAIIS